MKNEDAIISEIYKSFNQDNVILFAGSEAIKNKELSEKICVLPWSCVITTDRRDGFGTGFAQGRNPHRYISSSDLPINIFSRENLPIIQLYGAVTDIPPELEDFDEDLRVRLLKKQGEKILNRVMSKMDIRSRLIVVGYNPDSDDDISLETFVLSCQEIQGGSITFFNSCSTVNEKLKSFAEKNRFTWVEGKISDLLDDVSEDYEIQDTPSDDVNVFYKGQKPVFIKKSILSRSSNFARLLTEEKIREIRPLGRLQQSRWFYNFLNNSSDSPQWYGFLPQSDFYLKRSYEDVLLGLVRRLLSGKGMNKGGWNTPIILEGDPGSSKSVELAAVAYKIFEEKINPVIYINGDNLYFSGQSNETQVLDELMQEVEQTGEKDTRFLIVWDSSSYKNITVDVKQLAHELENRGRRFVLLCSAYSNMPSEKEKVNREYYSYDKGNQFEKTDKQTGVYYYTGCYFVSATRTLESSEINSLKSKATLYAVSDKTEINRIWTELEGNTDIFEYFYRLIVLLRPKLEAGLSKEQRLVNRYVRKQFSLIENKEEESVSIFAEALKKAGITLDESAQKSIEEEEANEDYDLERFNICIAMFSRFKLDTPYSLALKMLCTDNQDYFGASKVYDNYELFNLLTTQISYIHYREQTDGRYVFRFRSTLEAEIFLKNNLINEEHQLEIVGEMIDHYVENYHRSNEVDLELKVSIQSILKMYGPNTDYKEFWADHRQYHQHLSILKKLDPLAEKLHDMRTKYRIPDVDGGMALIEISFYRELYGNLWDKLKGYSRTLCENREPWEIYPKDYTEDSYVLRLENLTEASNLALESLEKLDILMSDSHGYITQRTIQTTINSLTVELAMSNSEIERIGREYEKLTGKDIASKIKLLSYAELYRILFKAISASPLDGYLYNALFKLFEKEYDKASEERRLYLLSDVGMIADDASTLEITGRGANDKDELSTHLHRIAQYSCSHVVRIDDIIEKTAPESFMKLFKSTVDRNNASGICFVCQQELNLAGLGGDAIAQLERETGKEFVLDQNQLKVCQKVVNFINNPEYSNCIDGSIQALYLLLRVEWMLYNGRPLSIGRECQKTYLNQEAWSKVYATCEKYESISGKSVRPVVTLIYALAKVQIDRDYLGAVKAMHRISDMPNQRMRVPYLICFEKGVPQKYSGIVVSTHNYSGFLKVDGLPRFSEKNQGVKFFMKNLGLRRMPEKNSILTDFYLGLSLANQFSAYKFNEEETKNE